MKYDVGCLCAANANNRVGTCWIVWLHNSVVLSNSPWDSFFLLLLLLLLLFFFCAVPKTWVTNCYNRESTLNFWWICRKMPVTFTKCYKFMKREQWVQHGFVHGLRDFKTEGKTSKTTKEPVIQKLQEVFQMCKK